MCPTVQNVVMLTELAEQSMSVDPSDLIICLSGSLVIELCFWAYFFRRHRLCPHCVHGLSARLTVSYRYFINLSVRLPPDITYIVGRL